ncbi:glutamate-5-semialdehyde dehydrogenase [bacterium]|nr:glutamate-5-semialdehyde dehydrogenase [bacterium]
MNPKQFIAKLKRARQSQIDLGSVPAARRSAAIRFAAERIWAARRSILAENRRDAAGSGQSKAFMDRLVLNESRLRAMVDGVRAVAGQPDPVGQRMSTRRRPNGLRVDKVRVPLGVVAVIYESRPNVTADAAALALRAGNAVVLRTGREAIRTSRRIAACFEWALKRAGLPPECVLFIDSPDRRLVTALLRAEGLVDVAIPRGGPGLIAEVVRSARVPVIKHYLGVCHTYVDARADLAMAQKVCFNAKVQRPGVCNAMETLLVHGAVAPKFLPPMARALDAAGVEIRACPRSLRLLRQAGVACRPAAPSDFGREFSDLILAVKTVGSLDEAIDHINAFGSRHSDAILTSDRRAADRFIDRVDSAALFVNTSTRFSDGGEFGLGAEVGISTDKLHARGPMGAEDLTTTKFVVTGQGQVRT